MVLDPQTPLLSLAEFRICRGNFIVCEDIVINFLNGSKCRSDIAVRTAVIKGDSACFAVVKRCTGEAYILHETSFFVPFFGREDIIFTAVKNL